MQVLYQFDGQDTAGRSIKIEIGNDTFQGITTRLPLSGVTLSRERGDGGILATSLSIKVMSMVNGDCDALYVTDSYKFNVLLYVDNKLTWEGYILREIRDMLYKDSPCEVAIQAIDGIGILKEIKYYPQYTRIPLWGVISWITSRINPNMEVACLSRLYEETKGVGRGSFLEYCYINDGIFKDMSAYDILAVVTENLSAYFTQINAHYLFFRDDSIIDGQLFYNEILQTRPVYTGVYLGSIGSAASGYDYCPEGSLKESVLPACRRLPVTISADSISALGEPFMPIAIKNWSKNGNPMVLQHTVDGQRQLYMASGRIYKILHNVKGPRFPNKLRISGATLGNATLHVVLQARSGGITYYYHDFGYDAGDRWVMTTQGDSTTGAYSLKLPGEISLQGDPADDNYVYGRYKVTKSSAVELEVDPFYIGVLSAHEFTISIYVDMAGVNAGSIDSLAKNGVWLERIEFISEAFEDISKVAIINENVIVDADNITVLIQEAPDDGGSQLFLPGVITDADGNALHRFLRQGRNEIIMPFNDIIICERAQQFSVARKVLKGNIFGNDAFNHLFYKHSGDSTIYMADKVSANLINRISQVELVEYVTKALFTDSYEILQEDDVIETYDSILPKEYRLTVTPEYVSAKGGNVNYVTLIEVYEYGILKERYPVSPEVEQISEADYVTVSGKTIIFAKQALVVGKERTCRFNATYSPGVGESVSKQFTIRQSANSYGYTSRTMTEGPDLVLSSNYVGMYGGSVSFDYQDYRFSETRKWASGDTETVEILVPPKVELIDAWGGVKLLESGGIYWGVEVKSVAQGVKNFVVRFTDWLTGGNEFDYVITQNTSSEVVTISQVIVYNNAEGQGTSVDTVSNITNKGKVVPIFNPLNQYPAYISFEIIYGANVATVDKEGILTVLPGAVQGSFCVVKISVGSTYVEKQVFVIYNQ